MSKKQAKKQKKKLRRELKEQRRQLELERQKDGQTVEMHGFGRLSGAVNARVKKTMSSLRFSLTLRIAFHYALQLLCTTVLCLFVVTVMLGVSQIPTVNDTMNALGAISPADGRAYSQAQIAPYPILSASVPDEPINGLPDKIRLLFERSSLQGDAPYITLYSNSQGTPVIAAFRVKPVLHTWSLTMWTLLLLDLYRVWYFLRKRNRLNKRVLRPIADMAATAESLSVNNLNNRINIDGTKNELKDLAQVINTMLDRIERSYNSQKQFVSDASHELRTPIAVIQGYTGMLQRWGKTDKDVLDEGITAIAQETESMKELVERLLFLARHDKKTLMLEMEDFDALEVLSSLHREAQMLSPTHRFLLEPVCHAPLNGDKGMVKQLLRILLDNAIKYTPDGGVITLGMRVEGQECVLSVTDTGNGISKEEMPRIFDRFYRSDKARKMQSSGHGLGLSIARIIVIAHDGRLSVRSKEGVGTTFFARLPLRAAEALPALQAQ